MTAKTVALNVLECRVCGAEFPENVAREARTRYGRVVCCPDSCYRIVEEFMEMDPDRRMYTLDMLKRAHDAAPADPAKP